MSIKHEKCPNQDILLRSQHYTAQRDSGVMR